MNHLKMIKPLLTVFLFLGLLFTTYSQNLSQAEIQDLVTQAKAMGYTDEQIKEYAKEQGVPQDKMPLSSVEKQRISSVGLMPGERERLYSDSLDMFPRSYFKRKDIPEEYYGYSFFSFTNFGGFESNLQVATPDDYLLGAGDEVFIDIYGKSEVYYESKVDQDGYVVLENIGPILVAGMTVEKATSLIKSRLSRIYSGVAGANPDTFVRVSLGSVRSIGVQLAGELVAPGTYKMSSFSTVLNALHMAGGPTVNGTLRNIRLFRSGKQVASFDLYKFLTTGTNEGNLMLRDNDVILVSHFQSRVELKGAFKRPGIFEVLPDETLAEVLKYAGGLSDNAYSERISLTRNLTKEKVVSDIYSEQFGLFTVKGGDLIEAGYILDRYTNRVQIKGAVFRPGSYAYSDGLTAGELIKRADGLRGDAFLDRVLITRMRADLTTETLSLNLKALQEGTAEDVLLYKEDIVWVQSIFDLKEEVYLKISGEVNSPGTFIFSEGMTVSDLIFKASGFTQAAGFGIIEISRRSGNQTAQNQTELIQLAVEDPTDLSNESFKTQLKPFDHVMVRRNPNFFPEKTVRVMGEVVYPGTYAIVNETERISDLIPRAGGLQNLAYPKGASLIRRTEFYTIEEETKTRQEDLAAVLKTIDTLNMTESDKMIRSSLLAEMIRLSNSENVNLSAQAKSERLTGIAERSALLTEVDIRTSELIPLDLEAILKDPGGKEDLILEEGDVISIPQRQETIRLRGKVLYPTTVKYQDNKGLSYFIDQAGGFDSRAIKRKTYVLYANGEVARTKSFLAFRMYPKVYPGTEVIVPAKPFKPPVGIGEYAGIGTSLAALLLAFSNLNF